MDLAYVFGAMILAALVIAAVPGWFYIGVTIAIILAIVLAILVAAAKVLDITEDPYD